ncbi:hypothetical protein QCD71_21645 [Sphingomonas sp. PsM26]|nr:hypothetical protein [Sphingomonas sp. PsM26]
MNAAAGNDAEAPVDQQYRLSIDYAREAITHNARLDEGVILLSKPFNYIDLASAVRAVIDKANI